MAVAEANLLGTDDGLHVSTDRIKPDCSSLLSGNMVVPVIKSRRTRGGLALEKMINVFQTCEV